MLTHDVALPNRPDVAKLDSSSKSVTSKQFLVLIDFISNFLEDARTEAL